jgi:hypothetical protein
MRIKSLQTLMDFTSPTGMGSYFLDLTSMYIIPPYFSSHYLFSLSVANAIFVPSTIASCSTL